MLRAQLAAKQAALAELDILANAAEAAAAENSALSTDLAKKARALAEQEQKIAQLRDQVPLHTSALFGNILLCHFDGLKCSVAQELSVMFMASYYDSLYC